MNRSGAYVLAAAVGALGALLGAGSLVEHTTFVAPPCGPVLHRVWGLLSAALLLLGLGAGYINFRCLVLRADGVGDPRAAEALLAAWCTVLLAIVVIPVRGGAVGFAA